MKKSILVLIVIAVFFGNPVEGQVGKFLNKVSKSVVSDLTGKPESTASTANKEPEPKCACEQAELVVDLGGKLKLMYSEITITLRDDGAILLMDRAGQEFYIVKDGAPQGPIKAGDPRLAGFEIPDNSGNPDNSDASEDEAKDKWLNHQYITKTGEKYLIKFNGKSYGPYAEINEFKVTKSKEKFAAMVVENIVVTAAEGKKMDEAIKKAKTEEEKRELAMKYSQQMAQTMQQGGGPMSMLPTLVTNVEGVDFDILKTTGGVLNNDIKYDDLLFKSFDRITDLSNKELLKLSSDARNSEHLFVNTGNTKYAWYNYGTLTFSDGSTMPDLFNPHLIKANGQVSIAYMYYSPKRNSILQCKIPF